MGCTKITDHHGNAKTCDGFTFDSKESDICCSMLLPCLFASMLATNNRHRTRINDLLPHSHVQEVRKILNEILEKTEKIMFDAREEHYKNDRDKKCDVFLIFLWVMHVRMFSAELVSQKWENLKNMNDFLYTIAEEKDNVSPKEIVIIRPNIEHNMLGVILGRGGIEDLGATLWGQTQLECYSDSMHGIWGMSYKYNERAMVFNEKNLIRLWDICYGSYSGGKDSSLVEWTEEGPTRWNEATNQTNEPYEGPSMAVMSFDVHSNDLDWVRNWPSPIAYHSCNGNKLPCDPDNLTHADDSQMFVMSGLTYNARYMRYQQMMPDFTQMHLCNKSAGDCAQENVASIQSAIAFQGSMRVLNSSGQVISEVQGCGHHGPDYVGIASKRNGKGMTVSRGPGVGIFAATA